MFAISSSRFRREVKGKLFFWRTQNQIVPTKLPSSTAKVVEVKPKEEK